MKSFNEYKTKLEKCGWKLENCIIFNDNRKSANYLFTNGTDKVCLFCENGIVKGATRSNGK